MENKPASVDEKPLHPDSQRALDLLASMGALHRRKAADYGSDEDPFLNYEWAASVLDVPGWKGASMRLFEKMVRLRTMILKGELQNEQMRELMGDIVLISAIVYSMFVRHKEGKKQTVTLDEINAFATEESLP